MSSHLSLLLSMVCAAAVLSVGQLVLPLFPVLPVRAADTFFCPNHYDKDYFIDKSGAVVLRPQYECAGSFVGGLAPVSDGKNYGYINKQGALAIPLKFDSANEFGDGLAAVKINGKYGYINKDGKVVIKAAYSDAGLFSQGLAAVRQGNSWGYIDKQGRTVIKPSYDRALEFSQGLAPVANQDRFGFIDRNGKVVVPLHFCGIDKFSEDVAAVQERGAKGELSAGFIDKSGKYVFKPRFDAAKSFSDGLALTVKDKSRDYVDHSGKTVIHTEYAWVHPFAEGLADVTFKFEGGPGGYIDKNGNVKIPINQDSRHESFSDGLALIHVPLPGAKAYQAAEYSIFQAKDYAAALNQLEQGINMSPVPRGYLHKAKAHECLGQPDKALADCKEGLELFPDNQALKDRQAELKKKIAQSKITQAKTTPSKSAQSKPTE